MSLKLTSYFQFSEAVILTTTISVVFKLLAGHPPGGVSPGRVAITLAQVNHVFFKRDGQQGSKHTARHQLPHFGLI
jgi:hypothetical protein